MIETLYRSDTLFRFSEPCKNYKNPSDCQNCLEKSWYNKEEENTIV